MPTVNSDRLGSWQRGATNPVVTKAVPTANVIQVGDLVATEAADDDPYAAADETWDTDLATTQENFHDRFLGVAMQRSRNGDTDAIRVATSGVFEFDCASDTYFHGQLVGPDKDTGNALLSQQVEDVATANLAVGRVVKYEGSAITVGCLVEIVSVLARGGPQAVA